MNIFTVKRVFQSISPQLFNKYLLLSSVTVGGSKKKEKSPQIAYNVVEKILSHVKQLET